MQSQWSGLRKKCFDYTLRGNLWSRQGLHGGLCYASHKMSETSGMNNSARPAPWAEVAECDSGARACVWLARRTVYKPTIGRLRGQNWQIELAGSSR